VTDDDGLKVLDLSDPTRPKPLRQAVVPLKEAQKLYVARTYAYVANGSQGLAIIDIENPEHPKLDQTFSAGGALNDTRAVQIGSVAASMYALVADGKNGFRVIQLISPDTVDGAAGFSPRPAPRLIATYPTKHPALSVSRGLDRDRVTDETGGQTVVFGRRGSRPFSLQEMRPFLKHANGSYYKVEDVQIKTLSEERVNGSGDTVKVSRTALLTKSGREIPSPDPEPVPEQTPLPNGPTKVPTPPGSTPLKPEFDFLPFLESAPATPAKPAPLKPPLRRN
jgi:hypothetical protein